MLEVGDSAGVELVRVRPAPIGERILVGTPTREIGVATGAEELELADVAGALRLPDGRIVVANGASNELRFFDRQGRLSGAVGREGQGPGEFQSLDYLGLIGSDTLVVYDRSLLRLSLFDLRGQFMASHAVAGTTLPYFVGHLTSGQMVAWQFSGPEPEGLGIRLAEVEYGTFAPSEGRFRTIGTYIGAEETRIQYRGQVSRAFRAFSREGDVAAGGEHIFVLSSTADNRIEVRGADGRLLRVIAVDHHRVAPTSADLSAWVESWMDEFGPPSQDVEDWWRFGFREVPPPDSVPLLRSLVADPQGNVCAERYPMTWGSAPRYWCFAPDGEFLHSIELPRGQVRRGPHPYWDPSLQIDRGEALGVWADDLGVEYVRLFALRPATDTY